MSHAAEQPEAYAVPVGLTRLANHWALVLIYGLVTLALGIVLVVWPDATVTVFVVLLAIQLIIAGVFRIVRALAMSRLDGGARALVGLSGGLALIVGLLILRDPLQTVVVLGLILGAWWVIAGVIDIIGAFLEPSSSGRGWGIFTGIVSILAGGFLLIYTDISLRVLVVFVAIWLIVAGVLAILVALRLRSARTSEVAAT